MGANLISYFRFDTCPSGNERGGGMVGVDRGTGRFYGEVSRLTRDLKKIEKRLDGTVTPPAKIACLFTFANHVEFTRNIQHPEFKGGFGNGYSVHLSRHLQALTRDNIRADIVYPDADFGQYEVIVAPGLYICPRPLARKLERFVAGGGKLLLTSYSGYADQFGTIWNRPIPAPMSAMFGVEVRDRGSNFAESGAVSMIPTEGRLDFAPIGEVRHLDEILPQNRRVETLAEFDNRFFKGRPALTRRRHGRGWAYYLGALLDQDGYNLLYEALLKDWGIRPLLKLPAGVHVTARVRGREKILFLGNSNNYACEVALAKNYREIISGRRLEKILRLAPFETLVLASS